MGVQARNNPVLQIKGLNKNTENAEHETLWDQCIVHKIIGEMESMK